LFAAATLRVLRSGMSAATALVAVGLIAAPEASEGPSTGLRNAASNSVAPLFVDAATGTGGEAVASVRTGSRESGAAESEE